MNRPRTPETGSALLASVITAMICLTLAFSAIRLSTLDRTDADLGYAKLQAHALAESGVERGVQFLNDATRKNPWKPFDGLDGLFQTPVEGGRPGFSLARGEVLADGARQFGTFSVDLETEGVGDVRTYVITATGYVPNRENAIAKETVQAVVRVGSGPSQVFDYSYFVNNWGWFYGNTIEAWGNVRSNGQFDADGYQPDVHGTPRYRTADGTDLIGYRDDNGDGLTDGSDGGVYAGWDIIGAGNLGGMGALEENQHSFQESIPMPNLSDLTVYEERSVDAGSSLQLGGQVDAFGNSAPPLMLADAVVGDDAGEPQHLILIGTAAEPILLDGPVVVRGDVIISGVVSGQGSIYAGGNVYVADDVTYLNGPSTTRPANEDEASTEAWLEAEKNADFLGLFARENIVLGDYTNSTWESYVAWWLAHTMNRSDEDAGTDQIPNTAEGRDGIAGTEDDDVLEDDAIWSVEHYTDADATLGLIPDGFAVGDPIPGSGEDIDGDGQFDGSLTMSDLALTDPLTDPTAWAGNLPSGISSYSDISSTTMTAVDGVLYTNHALAMTTLAWGQDFRFYGALVSRNESIIYGTDSMEMVFDRRLLGGGLNTGLLPQTIQAPSILAWRGVVDGDVEVARPEF